MSQNIERDPRDAARFAAVLEEELARDVKAVVANPSKAAWRQVATRASNLARIADANATDHNGQGRLF